MGAFPPHQHVSSNPESRGEQPCLPMAPQLAARPWQGGHLRLLSLLELTCTAKGMLRHSKTICRSQDNSSEGHKDSSKHAALLTVSPQALQVKRWPGCSCSQERSDFTELHCLLSYIAIGNRNCKSFFPGLSFGAGREAALS